MYVILEEGGDYYRYNELYNSTIYTNLEYVVQFVKELNKTSNYKKYSYQKLEVCNELYKEPEPDYKEQIKSKLTSEELHYLIDNINTLQD